MAESLPELNHLRLILSTGAELSVKTRSLLFAALRTPVLNYYGLTETCGLVIAESSSGYQPERQALGAGCEGIKPCVVDERGRESKSGQGQLRIYSPALYLGYWPNPHHQLEYFDTNDRVTVDAAGWVYYHGRMNRGVKSSATTWLYPETVEKWLSQNDAVHDYAVTTVKQPGGACIRCYYVGSGISHKQWVSELISDIGKDYQTTDWRIVDKIPRTSLGKIKWTELQNNENP